MGLKIDPRPLQEDPVERLPLQARAAALPDLSHYVRHLVGVNAQVALLAEARFLPLAQVHQKVVKLRPPEFDERFALDRRPGEIRDTYGLIDKANAVRMKCKEDIKTAKKAERKARREKVAADEARYPVSSLVFFRHS